MGAAYVLTGSINQAAIESGLSWAGRGMLAEADIADVAMAPAADMFEIGVKVQVLKRGTMFAQRGQKLYDLYRTYDTLETFAGRRTRATSRRQYFRASIDDDLERDASVFRNSATRARSNARNASRGTAWRCSSDGISFTSIALGRPTGRTTVAETIQIWCGPAMGAFNDWVRGSFLATARKPHGRPDCTQPPRGSRGQLRARSNCAPAAFPCRQEPLRSGRGHSGS